MLLIGTDSIDNNASFTLQTKREGPNVYIYAWSEDGITENTPALIKWSGSSPNATWLYTSATGQWGYAAVPKGTVSVAAGSWGWFQIRGHVKDAQAFDATAFGGSVGHAVFLCATATAGGFGATSSGYVGNGAIGQVGMLTQAASGSLTTNFFLTGNWVVVRDDG